MKKNVKGSLLKAFAIMLLLCSIGGFIYLNYKDNELYKDLEWNNYYNENYIELFYSIDDKRLDILNDTFQVNEIVKNEEGEINKVLKIVDIVNSVVEKDDVSDIGYFNGYEILSKKGETKKVSSKDMAIITRDFIASLGYYARVGEFRSNKSIFSNDTNLYVVEYYSKDKNKWIMIDYEDKGYFLKDNIPCSGIEILNNSKKELDYIGKGDKNKYYKENENAMKTYTIMIDNTMDMLKSNSNITFIKNKNGIYLMYDNKYIAPTIYTKNIDIFNNSPEFTSNESDSKVYAILMKKEGDNNKFIIGGFSNGSILDKFYIRKNDGKFEEVYKYSEIEMNSKVMKIEISKDGQTVDNEIEIRVNF